MTTADENSFIKHPDHTNIGHTASALIKQNPADFVVEEVLGFEFSGSGEHVMLSIKKQNLNTTDVADAISRLTGSSRKEIGFCGLKDKRAITSQWFSVAIPEHAQRDWSNLENEQIELLAIDRHCKKLKRGVHFGNRFRIKVRQYNGDKTTLARNMRTVKGKGVPNYFGTQRFGHRNLQKATALFKGQLGIVSRAKRGMFLSSVRSAMFNEVLAKRVRHGTWDKLLVGDAANLDGSNSYFQVREITDELENRVRQFDIHPSGPLFGTGNNPVTNGVSQLESAVFDQYPLWCKGLSKFGLRLQRRPLRLKVLKLCSEISNDGAMVLSFELRKGGFATSVLNELLGHQQN